MHKIKFMKRLLFILIVIFLVYITIPFVGFLYLIKKDDILENVGDKLDETIKYIGLKLKQ